MTDHDAALARSLHRCTTDALSWLDDYATAYRDNPDDPRVDAPAVARMRRSVDRLLARPGIDPLQAATDAFVDVQWWLSQCDDDEVDLDVAVKMLESFAGVACGLPEPQAGRLLDLLAGLAATEPHAGRRYELLLLPFETGLVADEPDIEEPASREWVPAEDR